MSETILLDSAGLPPAFDDVAHLEEIMTRPAPALIDDLGALEGDILVLGVGGKMGPTLARLAKRAAPQKRIVGVARFSEAGLQESLETRASRPSPVICSTVKPWPNCPSWKMLSSWPGASSAPRAPRK